jgi:hypothetical protein
VDDRAMTIGRSSVDINGLGAIRIMGVFDPPYTTPYTTPYTAPPIELAPITSHFFHIYTPFHIWAIDGSIVLRDTSPFDGTTGPRTTEIYASDTTNITVMWEIIDSWDGSTGQMISRPELHIMGISLDRDSASTNHLGREATVVLTAFAVLIYMIFGPIAAITETYMMYRMIGWYIDAFDSLYHETRSIDW